MKKQIKYPKGQEQEYKVYLAKLQERMEYSESEKIRPRVELNNQSIYSYFNENERIANTLNGGKKIIDPVEGKINIQTGSPEAKLDAVVSNLISLNLGTNVEAYDEDSIKDVELGMAMEDIIEELDEVTLDQEKQYSRALELLKQGTAFVEVLWDKKLKKKVIMKNKEWKGEFLKYEGHVEKYEVAYEGPRRKLKYGPHVWLGDYSIFETNDQPYMFDMEKITWSEAKARFGNFENFQYVKKTAAEFNTESDKTIYSNNWTLTKPKDGIIEVIKYQDLYNDHLQILINGVPMMPMGFPLNFISPSGYTITKSVYKIFHEKFAMGKSFVSSGDIATQSKILDLLMGMNVFKTLQSSKPPRANLSGQYLPKNFMFPGNIVGIDPTSVPVIDGTNQGVTTSEYQIYKDVQDRIDKSSVSNNFTGQAEQGNKTATESRLLAQQAEVAMGRTVTAAVIMEQRISMKLIPVILSRYFEPLEDNKGRIDILREKIKGASKEKLYKVTTREKMIDGDGLGERQIIPVGSKEMPEAKEVRKMEREEEEERGFPVQKIFINANDAKNWNLIWFVDIVPKEKDSKALRKAKFRETIADMTPLIELGSVPNLDYLETTLAQSDGKRQNELFMPRGNGPEGEMSNAASQALLQGGGQPVAGPDQITNL